MTTASADTSPALENRPAADGAKASWLPITVLALAQFVMVLDSTVMNVSLSTIVADLHTTIAMLQLAITLFTLTMAALMLVGGKLGDLLGRKRVFMIGLVVYGIGSLTTALSPNVYVLLLGWSIVEALGAVMVIPAIAALTAGNYSGRQRASAFAIIGGAAGAAVAAGPLIGGVATTYFSWRIVFVGEVVALLVVMAFARRIKGGPRPDKGHLDVVGAILSASGLVLVILGILKSSEWGLVAPKGALTIGGVKITPFGLSIVPFMIIAGFILLYSFYRWIRRMQAQGREPLLSPGLVRIQPLQSGLLMVAVQYCTIAGTFFVMPVYLQLTLQKNALQTGIVLLPLAAGVVVFSLAGGRFSARFAPRRIVQLGMVLMLAGVLIIMWRISPTLKGVGFETGLALLGAGAGFVLSQLGNINLSSVEEKRTSEVGGVQGVFQNIGSSLGTALIGAVLMVGLTSGFQARILANSAIPSDVSQKIVANTKAGVEVVSEPQAQAIATNAGLPPDQVDAIVSDYSNAQLLALKEAMLGVSVVVLLGFPFTRKLPARPLSEGPGPEEQHGPHRQVVQP